MIHSRDNPRNASVMSIIIIIKIGSMKISENSPPKRNKRKRRPKLKSLKKREKPSRRKPRELPLKLRPPKREPIRKGSKRFKRLELWLIKPETRLRPKPKSLEMLLWRDKRRNKMPLKKPN